MHKTTRRERTLIWSLKELQCSGVEKRETLQEEAKEKGTVTSLDLKEIGTQIYILERVLHLGVAGGGHG